jgi:uncharacterized UBP type Zn finger protein
MFIIENAGNTCYIDSLLMGLFFEESIIDRLLNGNIKSDENYGVVLYLQEYIKLNFVDVMRSNMSIMSDTIIMLRELLIENGWKKELYDEHFNQQDVTEFYTFLINIFNGPQIEITSNSINDNNYNNIKVIEKIPFIPLSLFNNTNTNINTNIKDMIKNWMFNKYDTYTMVNTPYIIALSINRFTSSNNKKNNTSVELQQNIRLHEQNFLNSTLIFDHRIWTFHAATCHKGDSINSGHYYTLLCKKITKNSYKYYIFDDLKIPCLEEVDMKNSKIANQLKTECVFVIYKYST